MIFIRYDMNNPHEEVCAFEVWDKAKGRMGFCGAKAVGQRGRGGPNSRVLCASHLELARLAEKVPSWDMQTEKLKGGK